VFAGQDLVVLARYSGSGNATIRLEGHSPDGPVTWATRARFGDHVRGNAFVARLWAAQRIGWLAAEKRASGGNHEIDTEIRTLGERYGIPTEFSSYLVLEPGMDVRRDVAGATGAAAIGRAASPPVASTALGERTRAVAPQAANEARFEDARQAANQRLAKSTAELETDASGTTRTVGTRLFTLADGVWKDAAWTPSLRVVRVRPFSSLYFDLMQRMEDLGPVFALGERVIVAGRRVAIELAPDGVEQLSAQALGTLIQEW
jgi:hypothetical protein